MVGLQLGPGALIPSSVLTLRVLSIVSENMPGFSPFHHCYLDSLEQINKVLCASVSCSVQWRYAIIHSIALLWSTELIYKRVRNSAFQGVNSIKSLVD